MKSNRFSPGCELIYTPKFQYYRELKITNAEEDLKFNVSINL